MLSGAEVAQFGRALDSTTHIVEGEAEDRVVAGSSPALGTTMLKWNKPTTRTLFLFSEQFSVFNFAYILESYVYEFPCFINCSSYF